MKRASLGIIAIFLCAGSAASQNLTGDSVHIQNLASRYSLFYSVDSMSKLYNGIAFERHPNKQLLHVWEIKAGLVTRFVRYSEGGVKVLEEHYNSDGTYAGVHFLGNAQGDTLVLDRYDNGIKTDLLHKSDSTTH